MTILITGSSGTIGTRLGESLLGWNREIIGIDKVLNEWRGDICKRTYLFDLRKEQFHPFKLVDTVIALAANARVNELVQHPKLAKDNFDITFNTLELCRKNDIKKIIFASSREVYSNEGGMITHSEDFPYKVERCESPYTASKIGNEALIHAYHKCYGIDYIILRYSNVYGMYDNKDRVVPEFIKLAKQNKSLDVYGSDKILDFTYIDDAIQGTILSIDEFDKVKNNVFNIASGEGHTLQELATLIIKNLNSRSKIVEDKRSKIGEVRKFIANIDKAKEMLGYNPRYDLKSGIEKTVEWYNGQ